MQSRWEREFRRVTRLDAEQGYLLLYLSAPFYAFHCFSLVLSGSSASRLGVPPTLLPLCALSLLYTETLSYSHPGCDYFSMLPEFPG
jgi:hypothetical protein